MKSATLLSLVLALLPVSVGSAAAIEINPPSGSGALERQLRDGDLQALRSQMQRQQFQQQQMQNRAQDRLRAPPPVLEVPKVKPSCQIQVYGNNYLKSCR